MFRKDFDFSIQGSNAASERTNDRLRAKVIPGERRIREIPMCPSMYAITRTSKARISLIRRSPVLLSPGRLSFGTFVAA